MERDWEKQFQALPEPAPHARVHAPPERTAPQCRHRRTIRTTPSGFSRSSSRMGSTHISSSSMCCTRRRRSASVEMVAPTHFRLSLTEPRSRATRRRAQTVRTAAQRTMPIRSTATSPRRSSTSTTACPPTTRELARHGVSVKGAIVIARYGGSWRGIKPKVAAEHGAVGCLIYSDPRDDGYAEGDVFPKGPMRPPDGVQRGSVMDMPIYPGDPLTPGVARHQGRQAARLERSQDAHQDPGAADLVWRCPAAARPRSEARLFRAAWRGALPITYRIGPRPGQGAPACQIQLGHEDALRRDRAHSGHRRRRTNGSSAGITTTHG